MSLFICAILILLFFVWLLDFIFRKVPKSDSPALKLEQANQKLGELQSQLMLSQAANNQTGALLLEVQQKFGTLQHQKISADVKMGQKFEVLLPFLDQFPYPNDEVKGLYQPLDLIVFREDEVVFCELKSGESQLSEKQRRIRDNIQAGRVRFELIRLSEKGITVK